MASVEIGSEQRWRAVYDTQAILATKISVHEAYSTVPIEITNIARVMMRLVGSERLLDVGCGNGKFLKELRWQEKHEGQLVGVDIAKGGFDILEGVNCVQASIYALPFLNSSLEAVTALHMLSHVSDMGSAMAEIGRVLRPNGVFLATANSIFSYPHVAEYRRRVFDVFKWGEPLFTTSISNLENLGEKLSQHWWDIEVRKVGGELSVPTEVFVNYFMANIPVWSRQPSRDQLQQIKVWVNEWAHKDASNGRILEPKFVGFALCRRAKNG